MKIFKFCIYCYFIHNNKRVYLDYINEIKAFNIYQAKKRLFINLIKYRIMPITINLER